MIITKNVEDAKKMIKAAKSPIVILGQDVVFNRKILEYDKFNILMCPERLERNRNLKQSNS